MPLSSRVRVRFAPSPTGFLHIGGLRTALYNYLFAKKNKGDFILRIEDTDQSRFVEGATENLLSMLKTFGLQPDEGLQIVESGGVEEYGSYGPYVQSKRQDVYQGAIKKLLASGHAYYCFCTEERLEKLRLIQQKKKLPTQYDGHCRTLSPAICSAYLDEKKPAVVRLRMPDTGSVRFTDLVRGEVSFSYSLIDDQVLMKSDGFPTYHLANVVDDHEMHISHVIRGEEWLSSVPKHLYLYHAFGWKPPHMAHLPILLDEKRAKLSKRSGAASVETFLSNGILPEALLNFLLLLGWNSKTDKEIFTREEMIAKFNFAHVQKSGAIVDVKKLRWMNKLYIAAMPVAKLSAFVIERHVIPDYISAKILENQNAWLAFLKHAQSRIESLTELADHVMYAFEDPHYELSLLIKKSSQEEVVASLHSLLAIFESLAVVSAEQAKEKIEAQIATSGISRGSLLWPMRVALTGKAFSIGAYELCDFLDKETIIRRLRNALSMVEK